MGIRELCLLAVLVIAFAAATNEEDYFHLVKIQNDREVRKGLPQKYLPGEWSALAFYNQTFNKTGWDILEIKSNVQYKDEEQMFDAGFLEGYLTQKSIFYYWYNNLKDFCKKANVSCTNIDKFISTNWNNTMWMAQNNLDDPFWYHVHLSYQQIKGIYEGYKAAVKGNKNEDIITEKDIIWMNFFMDIDEDLAPALRDKRKGSSINVNDRCSVLIKLLPGYKDIFFGHTSWTSYNSMNRVYKKYHFPIHVSSNSSDLIPGMEMTFSSYPGFISSADDFIMIKSGLVAMETTLDVFDKDTYKTLNAEKTILSGVLSMVANRLADNGSTWVKYFSKNNSGTYNNQWMIIDLKLFNPGFQPNKDFLWILEQAPGFIKASDETQYFLEEGYWASYNSPFYEDIYNYLGTRKAFEKYGNHYSHQNTSRALLFRRLHQRVNNLESMYYVMRYNRYKEDPESICERCIPKENPSFTIASRADLYPKNGSVNGDYNKFGLRGATDVKIANYKMFTQDEVYIQSGPTLGDSLPPFRWSTAQKKDEHHLGQPDLWNFKPFILRFNL